MFFEDEQDRHRTDLKRKNNHRTDNLLLRLLFSLLFVSFSSFNRMSSFEISNFFFSSFLLLYSEQSKRNTILSLSLTIYVRQMITRCTTSAYRRRDSNGYPVINDNYIDVFLLLSLEQIFTRIDEIITFVCACVYGCRSIRIKRKRKEGEMVISSH